MSFDQWLDERAPDELTRDLVLDRVGLSCEAEALIVPWDAMLTLARLPDALYLLVPRRPPKPPWVRVSEKRAQKAGTTLDELAAAVELRLQNADTYRRSGPTRRMVSPGELLERLRAGDPVPGTVEVPAGPGPWGQGLVAWVQRGTAYAVGGGSGAFFASNMGLLIGAYAGPVAAMVGAAVGAAAGFAGGSRLVYWVNSRSAAARRARVLVLAPDGCIAGLPTGVTAFDWSELAPLTLEKRHIRYNGGDHHDPHLVYRSAGGEDLGAIHQGWFAEPLELIVQVSEAYRRTFGAKRRGP